MQAFLTFFFFFRVCTSKGDSWSHAFLAETVENGDKNRGVTSAMHMFSEESLGKINAKMSSFFGTGRSKKLD